MPRPFPAAAADTSSPTRSSPMNLNDDDDDIQFLGSGPVARMPAMTNTGDLGARLVARLEALERLSTSMGIKISMLETKNSALKAEVIALRDEIGNLKGHPSSIRQLPQSLTESMPLEMDHDGSPAVCEVTKIIEGIGSNSNDRSVRMEIPVSKPRGTDDSSYSSMSLASTHIENLDRVSAVAAVTDVVEKCVPWNVLASFRCFGRLPPELRSIIWKLAMPESRVYSLRRSKNGSGSGYASAVVPALLHTCRESRGITMAMYTREHYGYLYYTFYNKDDFIYLDCNRANSCTSEGYCSRPDCDRGVGVFHSPETVQRFIFEVTPYTEPFRELSGLFDTRAVEEVLLVDPNSGKPNRETARSEFKEITTPFEWQRGRSLLQCWKDEISGSFTWRFPTGLKKISRVEYVGT